jgi:hypothetical protein
MAEEAEVPVRLAKRAAKAQAHIRALLHHMPENAQLRQAKRHTVEAGYWLQTTSVYVLGRVDRLLRSAERLVSSASKQIPS